MAADETTITIDDRAVRVSSPQRVIFPDRGWTKMDVVEHYLGCAEGALRGVHDRPCLLKRWPRGIAGKPFFQKRVEQFGWKGAAADVTFPAAHPGRLPVPQHISDVIQFVQLGCLDLNPWPVRAADPDHPDELRIDLDPVAPVTFAEVRRVAACCREILADDGLVGWPKVTGSRGIHIHVRLEPRWTFHEVRRAALALGREAERRLPGVATTAWWKEDRQGVFIDYNQNARDKTIAAPYSLRETGLVAAPFAWDELADVEPEAFALDRFPARWREAGDPMSSIDEAPGDLAKLLARVARDEELGLGDAPWPPHYPKQPGEPPRVSRSRARKKPPSGA